MEAIGKPHRQIGLIHCLALNEKLPITIAMLCQYTITVNNNF